jgi:hypothetical protein
MKKILAAIGFILFFAINQQVAYAGTLNEYETEVVNAAKGTFESHGITYQVDSAYVDELIAYLKEDNIDITAQQRDKAISIMFSNVEQGVEAGYLMPVEVGKSADEDGNVKESGNSEGSIKESGSSEGSIEGSDNSEGSKEKTDNLDNSQQDQTEELDGADESTSNITKDKSEEFVNKIMNQQDTITEIDTDKGKVTVTSGKDNNPITVNTVIKNTGFNLNNTFLMVVILVSVMVLCIVAAIQLRLFVHKEEKYKYEK